MVLFLRPKIGGIEVVTIEVRRDGVRIIGHARYAEIGKDIVCSAVSILYQNLVESMQELTKGKIQVPRTGGDDSEQLGYE